MYSFNTRLRYSQLDKNLNLSLGALINLFQDCSTYHSEEAGQGLDMLYSKNLAWFITGWQIDFYNTPERFGDVKVSTWAHKFDKILGYRNYTLTSKDDKTVYVAANSFWTRVDLTQLKPLKVTDEVLKCFPIEEPFPMEYLPRRLKFPKECYQELESVPVVFANLDSNNHMNNGQYLAIANALLPENFTYDRIRVEYQKSAVLNDIIYPKYLIQDNKCYMKLCDNNDIVYALIEFSTRTKGEKS